MYKLLDLRFVIGAFFCIIGILLLIYSFQNEDNGREINRWCGVVFGVFGLFMVVISLGKDAHDELLEEPKEWKPSIPLFSGQNNSLNEFFYVDLEFNFLI